MSPTTVDRTDTTSDLLVTEQSLLNWVGGNLTEGGTPYQIVQPKLYITDSANTREINSQDGQGNDIVEFIKARVNSSKDGGFDSTDDRRLTTNLAIHNHLQANYLPISNASNYLPISGASTANVFVSSITASTANLQSAVILYPQVDRITLAGPSYGGDPVREFGRLKTNYHQILGTDTVSQNDPNGANTNQPISCQSLLDAAANASFTTQGTGEHLLPPSGSSINTHLTTLLYASKVKFGQGAASTSQGADAVAIGLNAGQNQNDLAIAIGKDAGKLNQQWACIAIGDQAGETQQGGINSFSIAIGGSAGQTHQDFNAIAMGQFAGGNNQSHDAIAIGSSAGYNQQGINAIAIGNGAGQQSQGANAISIGHFPPGAGNSVSTAGQFQQSANSIVLNASGNTARPSSITISSRRSAN